MTGQRPRRGRKPNARGVALLLRAPVALYRCRLGWLLGQRFLLLTHRGRRTGRTYHTAVEVARYDRDLEVATVVSAWGRRADWLRNIEATPALAVQIGNRRYAMPGQRLLTVDERDALLRRYWRDHRIAAHAMARLFRWPSSPTSEDWPAFVASVEAVTFHLAGARGACLERSL